MNRQDALLCTADGEVFRGTLVGLPGPVVGEAVFNTAMTGYQEILTDPSYAGQIVVMTSPHVGNYGVNKNDRQSRKPFLAGFVTRSMSRTSSNWRSEGTVVDYLADNGVTAISDVDTRRLTRHLRDRGAMPVAIGSAGTEQDLIELAGNAPSMIGLDLASQVTTPAVYSITPDMEPRGRVVTVDLGLKNEIITNLVTRGLEVTVVPMGTSADEIREAAPDGIFLSNGPGDPEPLTGVTRTVAELLGEIPLFGICLGHQILGLAVGARTFKLPFGHHGGNHPVRRLDDGRVQITAQNHGFAVDLWGLSPEEPHPEKGLASDSMLPDHVDTRFGDLLPTHQNLNDGTLEGMRLPDAGAFSVQFHPEAAPGPRDAVGLFDSFLDLMGLAV